MVAGPRGVRKDRRSINTTVRFHTSRSCAPVTRTSVQASQVPGIFLTESGISNTHTDPHRVSGAGEFRSPSHPLDEDERHLSLVEPARIRPGATTLEAAIGTYWSGVVGIAAIQIRNASRARLRRFWATSICTPDKAACSLIRCPCQCNASAS